MKFGCVYGLYRRHRYKVTQTIDSLNYLCRENQLNGVIQGISKLSMYKGTMSLSFFLREVANPFATLFSRLPSMSCVVVKVALPSLFLLVALM